MTRHPKKTNIEASTTIENIPYELLCEVLRRVASSSFTDIFNAKLSCKTLNEVTEDIYIYRCISLDKFPIVPWKPLNKKQRSFLKKCKEFENPESIYRQAVLDYFNRTNVESACRNLEKAVKLGHIGALYVTCIVLLFSGDNESVKRGIKLIDDMRKSKSLKKKLILCRNNLINMLNEMWVKNPLLKEGPEYCTRQHQHHWKSRWADDEEEENDNCEACSAAREISYICGRYNWFL